MASKGTEPATFRLAAQRFNQLRYRVPPYIKDQSQFVKYILRAT
jgi:hypothetical protein